MEKMLRAKKQRFAIDFAKCTGMDSTFSWIHGSRIRFANRRIALFLFAI